MNHNKYIVRLSFIILFLNIVINMMFYRYFMIKEMIVKHVALEHTKIVELYTDNIWNTHQNVISKLHKFGYLKLLQDQEFIDFAKITAQWFTNLNINISLYDLKGNKFITSNMLHMYSVENYKDNSLVEIATTKIDKFFLKSFTSKAPLRDAFEGITSHILLPRVVIENESDLTVEEASFVTSYIPVIDNNLDFSVAAVFEINNNITNQWQNITSLEQKVFITFIIIFIIFCTIIISNTNYARQIIEEQLETNRNLKAQIVKVEKTSSSNTKFFANISHELRTPLNAIIGFSEILMSERDAEKSKNYIKDINDAGKHLLSMINDILDLSKASADKLKVDSIDLDLNKLISSSLILVKPRADQAEVALISKLPKEHVVIKANPKRLKQVFLNLLSNAVKFTNSGGSVTIALEKDELVKLVYIKVIDTGIGIEEKDIPKTLSAFGQIDSEFSRKYEGTGLGLPLTKKLVELMNGKFDLQSKINEGTTVTITFTYDGSIEI
ncbi:MAG: HAMP domain-containing sensor histidine kinase [Rickettsia endosymbiont of Ixodes persulcatus]|nr:HAMP domain-containing sensor histidine kinase [Rickettsia endosymbiont of Ixodes persulcatus]MCZ6902867.1 HAMP domain-containing sensor histidine kinase [Rickettsia endosymbiont of Ixodes persulcatus]MCZ6909092.1 HAMP domain-containing sensor histidine kinase [Rickettsia endosymbiont of Ixodes persulcatus]MCZ6909771.1 HAMP domain-containing sensor histidine kinase [Rickettsia endosymbiont of Ixodes persulcatus]MCZ6913557.1 HAMP domain-containing sensor histidine kinase [Rickettsia endosymbi